MDTPSGRAPLFSRPSSAWLSAGIRTRSRPPAAPPPRRSLVPAYIGRFLLCCASPATPVGAAWTRPLARTRADQRKTSPPPWQGLLRAPRPARPCRKGDPGLRQAFRRLPDPGGRDASKPTSHRKLESHPAAFERVAGKAAACLRSATSPSKAVGRSTNGCLTDKAARRMAMQWHADHRLGQRRPLGMGTACQARLRARRSRCGQGRQRPVSDHPHSSIEGIHRSRKNRSARRIPD